MAAVAVLCACTSLLVAQERAPREGQVLFYRLLGAASQRPLLPRTRTVCSLSGDVKTSTTGMASSGFTEYPFRRGRVDYTCAEAFAYFPRFVSGAPVDASRVNTGDILIDHVYEPDACVWGPSGRVLAQTFVARGRELVSLTLLVASRPGLFHVELRDGGLHGERVGSVRSFRSGHSTEWGWARWRAGDAPLRAGATYALVLWRDDGETWQPYLHATGDAYADGALFVDGELTRSDLGAWIVEEPEDVSRALVPDADGDGWVHGATGVFVQPRTPNLRLIDVTLAPTPEKCREVVVHVYSDEEPPRLLAGPKRNVSCISPGRLRRAQFLFAEDELRVTPGERVRVEVSEIPLHGELPAPDARDRDSRDLRVWAYGETEPGSLPAICNLRWSFREKSDLVVEWDLTHEAPVVVELIRLSPREERLFEIDAGVEELVVPELWRGHDHELRLFAAGPTGREWRTPVYRFRPPGGPHPAPPPYLYPEPPGFLPQISPPREISRRDSTIDFVAEVKLEDPDFENGLAGWRASHPFLRSAAEHDGIRAPSGARFAGFTLRAGKAREQVFEESRLAQRVATRAGHEYLLSAWAQTSIEGGPSGDTRVRLAVDTGGGEDFSDGTQWFWTDGRWLRFEHRFRARGGVANLALELFRWRDLDRASAHFDRVRLYDLGAARVAASAPVTETRPRRVALTHPREEASERTEAYLEAPPGWVVTGLGARAAGDNVTTLLLRVAPLRADGTLGESRELRGGWEPDAGLEARIDLPAGHIATGFGARIAPEWDVKTLVLRGRPLHADGTLGEEIELRAGVEPEGGLERDVRLEPGRVLTAAGLRCHLNDVGGVRASSAILERAAAARLDDADEER